MTTFAEYQEKARETDQNRDSERGIEIALLGLAGEAGSLLSEYKKKLRDGAAYRGFEEQVGEELGDLLWYVATIASRFNLNLDALAALNLKKTRRRFLTGAPTPLPDEDDPESQRLPRRFEYSFEYATVKGATKIVMLSQKGPVGDAVTDNAYADDGYRFHDVMHLALAAHLGWSPVHRKLLRSAHPPQVVRREGAKDEVEDGGRAQVIEEAIVALAYEYAERLGHERVTRLDWELLKSIRRLTKNQEVRHSTEAEWERAILRGFEIWEQLKAHNGGRVVGDLIERSLTFSPPAK